jgi:hypothetical protein
MKMGHLGHGVCLFIGRVIGAKKSGFEGAAQFGAVHNLKPGYAAQFMCSRLRFCSPAPSSAVECSRRKYLL